MADTAKRSDRLRDLWRTTQRASRPVLSASAALCAWLWLYLWIVPSMASAASPVSDASQPSGNAAPVREWKDPCLAHRWMLVEDRAHPGWPRRLVRLDLPPGNPASAAPLQPEGLVQSQASFQSKTDKTGAASTLVRPDIAYRSTEPAQVTTSTATRGKSIPPVPSEALIHAGDRITVEQKSSVVEASFEAVALQAAAAGDSLRVRLTSAAGGLRHESGSDGVGWGRVIAVVAVAKGRASWLADSNVSFKTSFAAGGSQP